MEKKTPKTVLWCDGCRRQHVLHCAHPEECSGMKRVRYDVAKKKYEEYKKIK
jgi:hypothetical protein